MSQPLRSNEFVRFVIAGAVNTGATYLLFVFLQFFLLYQIAYTIAYSSGILLSYWLNSVFVFQRAMNFGKMIQYPVVYLVQYIVGVIFMTLLVEFFSLDSICAAPIVIVSVIPITFTLSRYVIKSD